MLRGSLGAAHRPKPAALKPLLLDGKDLMQLGLKPGPAFAAWLDQAVTSPERTEQHADGTTHLLRRIEAFGNRWLRVVVSPGEDPTVITTFFDRRVQ